MNIGILKRAAAQTFEDLCFLDAQPVDEKSERVETRAAQVVFKGQMKGVVTVRLPESALREAAENMLGPEVEASPEVLDDVAREIANVVCGHVLPLVGGADEAYDISAPTMVPPSAHLEGSAQTAELSLNGLIASISLTVEGGG